MIDRPRSPTARQQEVYEAIFWYMANRGCPPSIRDLMQLLQIASPVGVTCHLRALLRKGLISYQPGVARSIQLVDPPQCPYCYFRQAEKQKQQNESLELLRQ